MSDKSDKLSGTITTQDRDNFNEYAKLPREGREAVRATAFENPDLHQLQLTQQRLDAAIEVLKTQAALIESLRTKEALLVSFSQHVANAALQSVSDDFPDVTYEIAIAAITKNLLELQKACEKPTH